MLLVNSGGVLINFGYLSSSSHIKIIKALAVTDYKRVHVND